jgi:hypothetical protein
VIPVLPVTALGAMAGRDILTHLLQFEKLAL